MDWADLNLSFQGGPSTHTIYWISGDLGHWGTEGLKEFYPSPEGGESPRLTQYQQDGNK